ncbi:MAG: hypothetical protein RLY97_198 [Pseudomonadota bacterium]
MTDPEWQVEQGIGEDRALLMHNDAILAARMSWPTGLAAGLIADALLISRHRGAKRGTMRFDNGQEALVDALPADACEGAKLRVKVTRAALSETGRFKRAQCRPTIDAPCSAPNLADSLRSDGGSVRVVRRLPASAWEDIFAQGWSGQCDFAGGALTISPTPAMSVIDIYGTLPPPALALAAVPALASALRQLDLAGNIGIDFPTLAEKTQRRAVDAALTSALDDWPHEQTAMNGFGFVQLVARLERPSILHLIAQNRPAAAARFVLRQAEAVEGAGAILITAHPDVTQAILPAWQDELARRTGRIIRIAPDNNLALDGGFAQSVPL